MSRFLIRSCVSCKNLASRVLGQAVKQFPGDFEFRYGHRPLLLESFVDTSHYRDTCYKAANWQWIGRTKGRGRQDSLKKYEETIKDIYVYPIDKDFRIKMDLPGNSGLGAIDIHSGIDGENWAENEFGGSTLGDQRCNSTGVDLLVRAQYDRSTTGEYKLFETVRQSPVRVQVEIKVPRQSARNKKNKQKARAKKPARTAQVSLRSTQIELNPPSYHKDLANKTAERLPKSTIKIKTQSRYSIMTGIFYFSFRIKLFFSLISHQNNRVIRL